MAQLAANPAEIRFGGYRFDAGYLFPDIKQP
jgi:hypothetical protein